MAAAEDALARLDERLAKSPIREGWIARTHFSDACAAVWLEGAAVHLEDLVLHDAEIDALTDDPELVQGHGSAAPDRRVLAAQPGWALFAAGLDALRGRAGAPGAEPDTDEHGDRDLAGRLNHADLDAGAALGSSSEIPRTEGMAETAVKEEAADDIEQVAPPPRADRGFAAALEGLDAAILGARRAIAHAQATDGRRQRSTTDNPLVYDLDWDKDRRLAEWLAVVSETRTLPPTLAAAVAADAWRVIEPLQHASWLGRLVVGGLLRARAKTRAHLADLHDGFRSLPYERRRGRDPTVRLRAELEAMTAAAELGLKAHDRWLLARTVLTKTLDGRRSSSGCPPSSTTSWRDRSSRQA